MPFLGLNLYCEEYSNIRCRPSSAIRVPVSVVHSLIGVVSNSRQCIITKLTVAKDVRLLLSSPFSWISNVASPFVEHHLGSVLSS